MGSIALTPIVRRIIELFDTRILFPTFYVIFMLSSAVSGSAQNIYAVIIGRSIMGLAYTGIFQL